MKANSMPSPQRRPVAKLGAVVVSVALAAPFAFPYGALAADAEDTSNANNTMSSMEQPPDMPSGQGGPGGGAPEGVPPDGFGGGSGGQGGPGGGPNTQSFDYSGTYSGSISADGTSHESNGETIEATETLTNAALAQNAGKLVLSKANLVKSGDANDGDACNFYGVNSIALAVGEGSQLNIAASTLSATSEGSNGVFATDNATAWVYDTTISTTADNSRGLDATYGGTIVASGVDVNTQGNHCAGIATDRGGGNVSASDSSFNTAGSGSPVLYSTGCIEVNNIEGAASGSQIAGMEGLNTIRVSNSTLTSTITGPTASDPIADGVIIYQSTSGDAETSDGTRALFQVVDSTLASSIQSGAMFYVTNTQADIALSGTTLNFDSSAANLLTAAGNDANSWGSAGKNGGDVTFTAIDENLKGNIEIDTISSLDLYLTQGTTYEGAIYTVENESGYSTDGSIDVVVDGSSTWTVAGDSTVATLAVADGGKVVDSSGKTATIVAGGQTLVQGEGSVTVTVTGDYSTTADVSGAVAVSDSTIDRGDFNNSYGLSDAASTTAAATNSTNTTEETATDTSAAGDASNTAADTSDTQEEGGEEEGGLFGWLHGVWKSFLGLFGIE